MSYVELSYFEVAMSLGLVLIVIAVSAVMKLGLVKSFLWASARTVVQLSLLGFVLGWVFSFKAASLVVAYGLLMTLIAGLTAGRRPTVKIKHSVTISVASIFIASWSVTALAFVFMIRVDPWYTPQYAIPLLGMVLGNMLNGVSLGLDGFLNALQKGQAEIETAFALGGDRWEVARPFLQDALRTGLMPITNTMMIVGLVSIPGMMTGQLLAGAAPESAVKYQIVIMFLIASACAIGTLLACTGAYYICFSSKQSFRLPTR